MGRLFWKFFGFIWLAQLLGIVGIGTAFWVTARHADRAADEFASGPRALMHLEEAASLLRYAGKAGFAEWSKTDPGSPVFAIDAAGRDVLGRELGPGLGTRAAALHAADPQSRLVAEVVDSDGQHYLLFTVGRGDPPGGPPGDRPLEAGPAGDGPPDPPGRASRLPPLAPMFATLLVSLGTAVSLAWYFAKPIRSLRFAFEALSAGNLTLRVGPMMGARQDELADLGRDFDRMAERLQASMQGQRQLLHDVSHEMRSPLARLQAAVGLLRQKYSEDDRTLERIEEEITRVDRLVGDLLKLSRLEAGELAESEVDVDLRELIFEIVSDANFEWQSSGRSVTWRHEVQAHLRGRPELLRGAIENVVRNAFKHAPHSREITVDTALEGTRYLVRVQDDGPGVPESDLPALFTPFFRSARAQRGDGYGLGLAIARRSIETHGGSIRAQNRPEGGLLVEISLPLRAAAPAAAVR